MIKRQALAVSYLIGLVLVINFSCFAIPHFQKGNNYLEVDGDGIAAVFSNHSKQIPSFQLELQSPGWLWWGQNQGLLLDDYPKVINGDWQFKYLLMDPATGNNLIVSEFVDRIENGFRITYDLEAEGTIQLNRGYININIPGSSEENRYLRAGGDPISLARPSAEREIDFGKLGFAYVDLADGQARIASTSSYSWRLHAWPGLGHSLFLILGEDFQLQAGEKFTFSFDLELVNKSPDEIYTNPKHVGKSKIIHFDSSGAAWIETKEKERLFTLIQLELTSPGRKWWGQSQAQLVEGYPQKKGNRWYFKMLLTDPYSGNILNVTEVVEKVPTGFSVTYTLEADGTIRISKGYINYIVACEVGKGGELNLGPIFSSPLFPPPPKYKEVVIDRGESLSLQQAKIELPEGQIIIKPQFPHYTWDVRGWEKFAYGIWLDFASYRELKIGDEFTFGYTIELKE